ncbi:MAG: tRNA dihydrouridine synthase DusB [Ruminococcaceae bacterium]|nr:tRNA dihydrouridine synthase DusB [Oscillospiraceae bacterium]
MKIGNLEIKGFAALAPMAGVADRAMREICRENGAAYAVGELASAKGISLGDKKSATYLAVSDSERPYGSQLFGCEPEIMAEAAKMAAENNPNFIDINMGCPAPKVAVSSGGGSALLKDPILAGKIIEAVANAVDVPVTVKIRAGWDENSINAVEIAKIAEQSGAKAITVHGRTRKQMYAPPVDHNIIREVKQAVSIPVIGNGDVDSPIAAAKMYEETGCDLIMVGRAAMGNPWIFTQINNYLSDGWIVPPPPLSKRMLTLLDQVDRMVEYKGERTAMMEARKHAAWYMRGLNGAAELRRMCGTISKKDDVIDIVQKAMELNQNI